MLKVVGKSETWDEDAFRDREVKYLEINVKTISGWTFCFRSLCLLLKKILQIFAFRIHNMSNMKKEENELSRDSSGFMAAGG